MPPSSNDLASRVQALETQQQNMMNQIETEHKERREVDTQLFQRFDDMKDQQSEAKESMTEKVNEIKTAFSNELGGIKLTMAKWTGIAIGGVFVIDLLIKGGLSFLTKK